MKDNAKIALFYPSSNCSFEMYYNNTSLFPVETLGKVPNFYASNIHLLDMINYTLLLVHK